MTKKMVASSAPLVCEQETAVVSSDSDSSFSDSDELVCQSDETAKQPDTMDQLSSLPHDAVVNLLARANHKPEKTSPSKESFVVHPTVNDHQSSSRDDMNRVEGPAHCDDGVMSLCDLDQYGVMLEGLIDELSIMSDKLVRCSQLASQLAS